MTRTDWQALAIVSGLVSLSATLYGVGLRLASTS